MNRRDIEELSLAVPPLDEQRRIAALLDSVERLRLKAREQESLLEALPAAAFARVASSSDWPVRSLGEIVKNEDAERIPLKAADRARRSGRYAYFGASGEIDRIDGYLFEGTRLLVSEDGANLVARVSPIAFLATGRFWVNNHAHVLAPGDGMELRYLQQVLESADLTPYVSGTAQPKLNRANLDRIPVPVPPPTRQQDFGRLAASSKSAAGQGSKRLAYLNALFASLQHRAFAGEL